MLDAGQPPTRWMCPGGAVCRSGRAIAPEGLPLPRETFTFSGWYGVRRVAAGGYRVRRCRPGAPAPNLGRCGWLADGTGVCVTGGGTAYLYTFTPGADPVPQVLSRG
jgi:hypothetical protein